MPEKPTILVVDDELGPRESLRMILKDRYHVVSADSGEAAIKHLTSSPADVVLLDIRMPGMDGIETLKQIKEVRPDVEVVMITAYASLNTAQEAMRYCALDYVIKPFSVETINQIVEKGINRRQERLRFQQHMESIKEQMEALTRASLQIGSEQEILAVISAMAEEGARLIGASTYAVCSLSFDGKKGLSVLCGEMPPELIEAMVGEYREELETEKAQPLVISIRPEGHGYRGVKKVLQKSGYRTVVLLPLIYARERLGILVFGHREPNKDYFPRELELAGTFAHQLAAILKNKQLYEDLEEKVWELNRKVAQLNILREISGAVLGNLDLNSILTAVVDSLRRLGYDYADISSLKEWVKVDTALLEARCEPLEGEGGFRITCPVVVDGKVAYLLEVHTQRSVDEKELELISMLSEHIAIAVKNSWLYREMSETKGYLESLINNAGDAIVAIGEDDRIISWNEAAEQVFGFARDDIIGKSIARLIPEVEYERSKSLLLTQRQAQRFETKGRREDGTSIDLEVILSPIKGTEGEMVGLSAIIKDMTERNELERQLIHSEKQRALGVMSSGVIHNFNNILTVILGQAELLQMQLSKTKGKQIQSVLDSLKVIEQATMDGAAIIKRIQEFTRGGEGMAIAPVDLNQLIKDSLILSKPRWKHEPEAKGIKVEVRTELGDIPSIKGNRTQLTEVLLNMLFNAVEAMPRGGEIFIRTWRERDQVCLSISDTGIGMSPEIRDRVFDPFFTTKGVKGVGLGLSVVYGIVKRHDGHIAVESTEGKGTTFTIKFPVPGGVSRPTPRLTPTTEVVSARILLIEDEEAIRNLFSQMVEGAGHQVVLAASGIEGLKILEKRQFDVLFTDLGMPDLSGWQVARIAKEIDPALPVILCTGWGVETDRGLEEGGDVDFVVSKPFKMDTILDMINQAMELRRRRVKGTS